MRLEIDLLSDHLVVAAQGRRGKFSRTVEVS